MYIKLNRSVKLTNFFYNKKNTNTTNYINSFCSNTKKKYFYYNNLKLSKILNKDKLNYDLFYRFEKKIKIFLQRNANKFFFNTIYQKYFKMNSIVTSYIDKSGLNQNKLDVFKHNIFDHCFKLFKPKLYLLKR